MLDVPELARRRDDILISDGLRASVADLPLWVGEYFPDEQRRIVRTTGDRSAAAASLPDLATPRLGSSLEVDVWLGNWFAPALGA